MARKQQRKRDEPKKREPGLQVHLDDGQVMPLVIPAMREETVIRISKAKNGSVNVNAPKYVVFIKRDKRPPRKRLTD